MKKALLSFLLLVACASFAMAQHVDRINVSACQTYTWTINGETYTNDTVVMAMNTTFDTIHVLYLTINNAYNSYDTIVSTACQYMWRNDTVTTTGDYQDLVEAAEGSGLCDSAFFAYITIPEAVFDTTVANACGNYVWNNDTLTITGFFFDTVAGTTCQEIHVLDLTVTPNHIVADTMEQCNSSYSWRNLTLTESGDYSDTVAADICDTIYTINFTLVDHKSINETAENCGNYDWHNRTLTATGTYYDTVANDICDTVYTLNLTVNNSTETFDTVQQCGKYNWHGNDLTASDDYTELITDTLTHCDTTAHLNLTIVVDTVAQTTEACGEKEWNYTRGIRTTQMTDTLTATGLYYHLVVDTVSQCSTYTSMDAVINQPRQGYFNDTIVNCNTYYLKFTSINGKNDRYFYESIEFDTVLSDHRLSMCNDSNIHLSITINNSYRDTITEIACDRFHWDMNNVTYTKTPEKAPIAYSETPDSNGCDSIRTLMLTIKKSPVISAINGEWHLNAGDTAVLYPTCTSNAAYTWSYNGKTSHADTLVIPNVQGNFDVSLEAVINYNDIDLVCADTSWITIVTFVGIDDVNLTEVSLYPNPTVGQLNIESAENVQEVAIFNTIGQQVAEKHNLGTKCTMDLSSLSKGTYTMRLRLQNGQTVNRKFVITK